MTTSSHWATLEKLAKVEETNSQLMNQLNSGEEDETESKRAIVAYLSQRPTETVRIFRTCVSFLPLVYHVSFFSSFCHIVLWIRYLALKFFKVSWQMTLLHFVLMKLFSFRLALNIDICSNAYLLDLLRMDKKIDVIENEDDDIENEEYEVDDDDDDDFHMPSIVHLKYRQSFLIRYE